MSEPREFLGHDGQRKYFLSEEKAVAFIAKRKAEDTHHAVNVEGKFIITPKEVV
jgi:hypothetical protein